MSDLLKDMPNWTKPVYTGNNYFDRIACENANHLREQIKSGKVSRFGLSWVSDGTDGRDVKKKKK